MTNVEFIRELIAIALLLSGCFFMMIAGIGVLRLPDLFSRMHAATKASSFGAGQILLSVAIYFGTTWVVIESILIIIFIFMTAPVGSHLLGRSSYFLRIPMWEGTKVDELQRQYDLKKHTLSSDPNAKKSHDSSKQKEAKKESESKDSNV